MKGFPFRSKISILTTLIRTVAKTASTTQPTYVHRRRPAAQKQPLP